ncbi:Protein MITOFERRIN like 1, chloroplastic [Vitis vinifera]|uniref:Protein MITOFERRIN like 1, chloroplastic n=1 Tax=Vitis vinifera TaxID=29760 RepID=A0A438HKM1_VITVI|nr:Protein MITOFERRIN like 1, chloroplastic [Vitis vinifera]
MDARLSIALGLPPPNLSYHHHHYHPIPSDFTTLFNNLTTALISTPSPSSNAHETTTQHGRPTTTTTNPFFFSTSMSQPASPILAKSAAPTTKSLIKSLSVFERALIGAGGGGIAGAFTYFCLHPLDTIKTKLQTRGASEIYKGTLDAIVKTFQERGVLGFYSGISAVIVGSAASSAVYLGLVSSGSRFWLRFRNTHHS